jgi:hypothetical protein
LLTLAPVLLLSYTVASLRYRLGLSPKTPSLAQRWLQRLAGPEALIITALLLGPMFAILQLVGLLLIGGLLTWAKIEPTDPHTHLPQSALRFGFSYLVDRSAPWVILSLILANLIGHPSVPLASPITQVAVLLLVFLPMRFCNLGGAVLALSLAYSGWSNEAVLLALLAAPIFNLAQLKLMNWTQRGLLFALILASLVAISLIQPQWQAMMTFPAVVSSVSLTLIALLFAASLLRLGPRKFMARIMHLKPKVHAHAHSHNHSHEHDHKH